MRHKLAVSLGAASLSTAVMLGAAPTAPAAPASDRVGTSAPAPAGGEVKAPWAGYASDASPAHLTGQGPDRAGVRPAGQQSVSGQAEPRASIPWKKRGSGKVRGCARHGKLNTWGYTDKLTLKNTCGRKFTYHLEIKRNPDRCVTVKKHKSKKVTWSYPGKLVKVRNGRVGGRC